MCIGSASSSIIHQGKHIYEWFHVKLRSDFQFAQWVDAVMFVFSLESHESIETSLRYYEQMAKYRNISEVPVLMVGTQVSAAALAFFVLLAMNVCVEDGSQLNLGIFLWRKAHVGNQFKFNYFFKILKTLFKKQLKRSKW